MTKGKKRYRVKRKTGKKIYTIYAGSKDSALEKASGGMGGRARDWKCI